MKQLQDSCKMSARKTEYCLVFQDILGHLAGFVARKVVLNLWYTAYLTKAKSQFHALAKKSGV